MPNPPNKKRPGDNGYVGRGHPPSQHRFKPGQSGNPVGRPKGRHRFERKMEKLLNRPIQTSDGRELTPESLLLNAVIKGIGQGNLRAVQLYLEMRDRFCRPRPADHDSLDETRQAILRETLARLQQQDADHGGEPPPEDPTEGDEPEAEG